MVQTIKNLFTEIAVTEAILLFCAFLLGAICVFVVHVRDQRVFRLAHEEFVKALTAAHSVEVIYLRQELKDIKEELLAAEQLNEVAAGLVNKTD